MACSNCNKQVEASNHVEAGKPIVIIANDRLSGFEEITWEGKLSDYPLYIKDEEEIYKILKVGNKFTVLISKKRHDSKNNKQTSY